MFFRQTLEELARASSEDLSQAILKRLETGGIELAWVDCLVGEKSLFLWLPSAKLLSVVVHEAVVHEADFQRHGAPYYHFAPCKEMKQILGDEAKRRRFFMSAPKENRFDFKTVSGRSELRFFRDKPLEPCPSCLALRGEERGEPWRGAGRDLARFPTHEKEGEWRLLLLELMRIRPLVCEICHQSYPRESLRFLLGERVERVCVNCNKG